MSLSPEQPCEVAGGGENLRSSRTGPRQERGPSQRAAGSDRPFSNFQPETSTLSSSPRPPHSPPRHHHPTPSGDPGPLSFSLPLSPSFSLPPASRVRGSGLPACSVPPFACLLPPSSVCGRVCECACAARLSSSRRSRPARPSRCAPGPSACPGLVVLVSSCISLFSPLSLCPSSDLDRDFWNNNESTVQQKWSSYPPKEFILNISPYAPYGDPRLSLK